MSGAVREGTGHYPQGDAFDSHYTDSYSGANRRLAIGPVQ